MCRNIAAYSRRRGRTAFLQILFLSIFIRVRGGRFLGSSAQASSADPSLLGGKFATITCPRVEGSAQLLVQIAGGLTRRSGHERHARAKEGANGSETGKKTAEGAHRFLSFLPLNSPTLQRLFVSSVIFMDIGAFLQLTPY
jgi:hypothetical protein